MPIKRPKLSNGGVYHIVMRGVEGKIIFPQKEDHFSFLHDLYEFNDEEAVSWEFRAKRAENNATRTVLEVSKEKRQRKLLVEILAFCLMPNHFHLLLRQLRDEGISKFMRKMGGYATYINKKYNRQGHLYQGRFKAVEVLNESQLRNTLVYIHTNPVSLIEENWKGAGSDNPKKALKFLKEYKWSSHLDYIGIKNYPSLLKKDFLCDSFGSRENFSESVEEWVVHKKDFSELNFTALE